MGDRAREGERAHEEGHEFIVDEAADAPAAAPAGRPITYGDLYDWGLSGTAGASERKYRLLAALGLPPRLSKKEMLDVFNRLYTFEQLQRLLSALESPPEG